MLSLCLFRHVFMETMLYGDFSQVFGIIWGVFLGRKQEVSPDLSWDLPDVASWADGRPEGLDGDYSMD